MSVVDAHLKELPVIKFSVCDNKDQDKLPTMYWLHKLHNFDACLFEWMLNVPVNSQWSCRDAASILWDFYPKSGRRDIKKVLRPNEICMDSLTGTTFPGQTQT